MSLKDTQMSPTSLTELGVLGLLLRSQCFHSLCFYSRPGRILGGKRWSSLTQSEVTWDEFFQGPGTQVLRLGLCLCRGWNCLLFISTFVYWSSEHHHPRHTCINGPTIFYPTLGTPAAKIHKLCLSLGSLLYPCPICGDACLDGFPSIPVCWHWVYGFHGPEVWASLTFSFGIGRNL